MGLLWGIFGFWVFFWMVSCNYRGGVVVGLVLSLLDFSVFLVVPFKVSCSCVFSILQDSHTSLLINMSLKRHLEQRIVTLSSLSMQ